MPFATLSSARSRRLPALLLWAAPLLLAGCGLSDYNGQMTSEQERLEAFDKEAAYLNGPIKIPLVKKLVENKEKFTKDEVYVSAFEGVFLFVRVPLGINPQADEKDNPVSGTFFTYRYSASKNHPIFKEVRVAATVAEHEKEFLVDLAQQGWNETVYPAQTIVRKPYGRDALTFRTAEIPGAENSTLSICNYVPDAVRKKQSGDARLTITFVLKGKASPLAREQMDACLTSVGFGAEAARLGREYKFQQEHKVPTAAPTGFPVK